MKRPENFDSFQNILNIGCGILLVLLLIFVARPLTKYRTQKSGEQFLNEINQRVQNAVAGDLFRVSLERGTCWLPTVEKQNLSSILIQGYDVNTLTPLIRDAEIISGSLPVQSAAGFREGDLIRICFENEKDILKITRIVSSGKLTEGAKIYALGRDGDVVKLKTKYPAGTLVSKLVEVEIAKTGNQLRRQLANGSFEILADNVVEMTVDVSEGSPENVDLFYTLEDDVSDVVLSYKFDWSTWHSRPALSAARAKAVFANP